MEITSCHGNMQINHFYTKYSSHKGLKQITTCPSQFVLVYVDGVTPCLWNAATDGPTLNSLYDIWVWRATVEWCWQDKTEELGDKPVPVRLCPPQVPHRQSLARTRTCVVRDRRLTPEPRQGLLSILLLTVTLPKIFWRFVISRKYEVL
jgi:hypothetical protein